jgi:hypothetical protein
MRPHQPSKVLAVVAVFSTLAVRTASAAELRCPAVRVEADADVREAYPDLADRIRGEFGERPDVDACARVALRARDGREIEVSVALPDGRTSSRRVAEAEDVVPTLQALLLIPVSEPPLRAEPARSAPLIAVPPRTTARVDATSDSRLVAPRNGERELGVELSALTGARAGDRQLAYGAGALSLVEVSRWLIGFEGRIDAYRSTSGSDPESALELALLFGRRAYFDSVALDFTIGPALAMKGIAPLRQVQTARVDSSEVAARPQTLPAESSTGPLPRLLVGARLGFAPRSVLRAFVGFEAELGPGRADEGDPAGPVAPSPSLPRYTAGLVVGATVGTL